MKITAIKAQTKSSDRVSLFVNGKYSFSLTLDQLLEQKLKKNDNLDENRVKQLKKISDEGKLKQRAIEWVLGRPHSIREFRDYLYRKHADKELIETWVEEFTEKHYLDEEQFARWFADKRRRKNKSNREITAELYSKGIPTITIQNIVREFEDHESATEKTELEALKELVNKLRTRPRYQDEQALRKYLLGKGFSYSDIKQVLLNSDNS
jgi:regulatory protein